MRKAVAFVAGFVLGAWLCAWVHWLAYRAPGYHEWLDGWYNARAAYETPFYLICFAFSVGVGVLFARISR